LTNRGNVARRKDKKDRSGNLVKAGDGVSGEWTGLPFPTEQLTT